jgi:poly-gamma-glutamate capsule biosynthesis protein CapA/YwtB (metallophosphatase superfamily)
MENGDQPTESPGLPLSHITISLCGDVMTGRGIDQILAHPSDPTLHEAFIKDAGEYVELAERANGPITRPVGSAYVWGHALEEWDRIAPDVRIANLETSVTTSNEYWPGKDVHYRMNPDNVACLAAAKFDCWSLANNHVLDWGHAGLVETLQTLNAAGLKYAGAGTNQKEAAAPVVLEILGKGRVIVFSFGSVTSGIPYSWAAQEHRAGVNLLADMSENEVRRIQQDVAKVKRHNDLVVASIHWGPNWGYEISEARRTFAHRLIDSAGIDLIHGHSSHHVLGMEVYRGHLILYGCGEFLDDYEGISGYEEYRDDLGLIYFADIEPPTGELRHLQMTPTRIRRMRVERAVAGDAAWLRDVLNRESQKYGVQVESADGALLTLKWKGMPAQTNDRRAALG